MRATNFSRMAFLMVMVLACGLALQAQPGVCGQQPYRGVWCTTCSGFVDLHLINPSVPENTMVPFSMLQRTEIGADGKGSGKGQASVGGVVMPFTSRSTFTANSDCSGEKTYELNVPGLGIMPGTGWILYVPAGQEFKVILLNPGHAITCTYKRIHP